MVSTFTPNINLEEPARGDQVGTWDTPVNSNMTLLDLVVGANAAIGVGSGNITLSAAQFRSAALIFNSTLIQNTTITFPSTFTKLYTALHTATASSGFTITLATTVAGGQAVAIPPGQGVQVYNDGTNIKFVGGLEPVGTYWDYAGSSVPAWVSACTVPPYLNCDGTAFSAATYPALAVILQGTTLPDSRGLARYTLNQGTGRLVAGTGGIDGNTIRTVKASQTTTIVTANLPPYTPAGSVAVGAGGGGPGLLQDTGGVVNIGAIDHPSGSIVASAGTFTGTAQGGTSTALNCIGTAYIGGLTLIRAA